MIELVGNMHMHTPYSDGEKYHRAIAEDAIAAGLDFIIVTDHNVWVDGLEGYVENAHGRVLLLVGEEVHDTRRDPQANHLLVYGAEQELAPLARDPQQLIDAARAAGGLTFLAHPHDRPMPLFGGIPDLGWHNWEVRHYTGLEIWNYMSSFTNELSRVVGETAADNLLNRLAALPLALRPERYITAPEPATLAKWDELLAEGRRVAAVGNSDVHGTPVRLGPVQREIFPYDWCFRAVNTHIRIPYPLTGDLATDKALIYDALGRGCGWVGYDMAHPTRGFQFWAEGRTGARMGDEVALGPDTLLRVHTPAPATIRLIRHGQKVKSVANARALTFKPDKPGAYRVECSRLFHGRRRGWIYSNPIYLR